MRCVASVEELDFGAKKKEEKEGEVVEAWEQGFLEMEEWAQGADFWNAAWMGEEMGQAGVAVEMGSGVQAADPNYELFLPRFERQVGG